MFTRRKFIESSALALGGLSVMGFKQGEAKKAASFPISLNVSTIRPYRLNVEQQIEVCGKAGFDGIELWVSDLEAYREGGGSWNVLATQLKNNHLVLDNIIGFAQWAADDQSRREAGLEQMKREMEMTASLGGKFIAAPMQGIKQLDMTRLDDYAERFLRVIETGKAVGIVPLLELWGQGALSKLANAVNIVIATGHPDANLLLDFYHLYRGGNSFDSLKLINLARLPVFHINDYPATPQRDQLRDSDRVYPGDGICPFNDLIPLLKNGGFQGSFSVELFNEEYCKNNTVEHVLATTLEKTRKVIDQSSYLMNTNNI